MKKIAHGVKLIQPISEDDSNSKIQSPILVTKTKIKTKTLGGGSSPDGGF